MYIPIERILCIHALFYLFVLVGELLSFLDHFFYLARAFVLSTNVQNSVRINLKSHLDLRLATRSRWDPTQLEFAEQVVVFCHRPLPLEDLDVHSRLVVL